MQLLGGNVRWDKGDWQESAGNRSLDQKVEVNGVIWRVKIQSLTGRGGVVGCTSECYYANVGTDQISVVIKMGKEGFGEPPIYTVQIGWSNTDKHEQATYRYCFNTAYDEANVIDWEILPADKPDLLEKIFDIQQILSVFDHSKTFDYALKHLRHKLDHPEKSTTYILFRDVTMSPNKITGSFLLLGPRRTLLGFDGSEKGFLYGGFQLFSRSGEDISSRSGSLSLSLKDGYYEIFILNPANCGNSTWIKVFSADDSKNLVPETVEIPGDVSQFILSLASPVTAAE
ncbi:MAG: hypothetical protein WCT08_03505 [Patescibacteria group bacterium]|jgi:hypothetical protein